MSESLSRLSAQALRRELSGRNLLRAKAGHAHEQSFGALPSVVYCEDERRNHGNFLPASYKRIVANEDWRARLQKAYTGSAQVPRRHDRERAELDCATSSDALLMNLFCYPGVTRRREVCSLLGIAAGARPEFGVRAMLPMRRGEVDRTEIDMRLGELLVEAKLTEGGFGAAALERVRRYEGAEELFDLERLPRGGRGVLGWQLVRGVLAAHHHAARFMVLYDARRADLFELCFRVFAAVEGSELRSRVGLISWQELAGTAPIPVRRFLAAKYGILCR